MSEGEASGVEDCFLGSDNLCRFAFVLDFVPGVTSSPLGAPGPLAFTASEDSPAELESVAALIPLRGRFFAALLGLEGGVYMFLGFSMPLDLRVVTMLSRKYTSET